VSMSPADLAGELMPCVRCGQCRSVCPVFLAKGIESDSPRGRVALVRALLEGRIEPNDLLAEKIEQCALCRTCFQECPSGVHVERIILAARERLASLRGIPVQKKVLTRWLLPNANRVRPLVPLASRAQGLIGDEVGNGEYRLPNYRLPLVGKRLVPNLTGQTIYSVPSGTTTAGSGQRKVTLFAGCMIAYGYPKVGRAVLEVLRHHGVEVAVPKGQVCCGLPTLASGDTGSFERVKQRNLKVLRATDCDAIVTACASCGSTLKEYYQRDVPVRVYDFSEFLVDQVEFRPPRGTTEGRVTYHDPCHLRKAQGIANQPRRLLKSLPGVSFHEVSNPERCCGFGGTFSLSFQSLSDEIGGTKVDALIRTGAETVVTTCPGCMLHLANGLFHAKSRARVVHLAEVLATSYREDGHTQ
jgi:glycolate oxidase iron-sulfur subunit